MKTALLLYPYDSVLKLLKVILERRGFSITSLDEEKGIIRAEGRAGMFKKSTKLDIRATKLDQHTTHLDLWINENQSFFNMPRTPDEFIEEKLISTIYKYF